MNTKKYENPPKEFRAVPFWSWNDRLEPELIRYQIGQMDEAGLGGYFMHARTGLATGYMGEDWMKAIETGIDEGKKHGMSAWGYDEEGYPSGYAGGAVQAAGEKVLYFPLEMSATNTFLRLLINKGYIDSREAKTGKPQNNDNLLMGLDYIDKVYKSRNFQVYEAQSSIEKIESAIKKEKPYLVVIDQLTQMRANVRFGSVRERFSHMTSTLKAISLREHVSILLLCQLNRTAADSPPTMAQLKESGSIEEDSDNIILFHNLTADQVNNPESIDWKNERPMLCTLAKQREGETGEFVMMFKPSRFAFFERSTR